MKTKVKHVTFDIEYIETWKRKTLISRRLHSIRMSLPEEGRIILLASPGRSIVGPLSFGLYQTLDHALSMFLQLARLPYETKE